MIGRIQIYSLGQIYIVCHAYLEMIIFVHVKDDNSKHMKMTIYELCHACDRIKENYHSMVMRKTT